MSTIFTSRQLFENILDKLTSDLTNEDIKGILLSFFYMFKDELIESLNLVENITLVYANQRQVYEVINNNKIYHCFKHTYYCTCLSFTHKERINKLKYKKVNDDYLIKVLRGF